MDPAAPALTLRDRIGIDFGRRLPAEAAVAWAGARGIRFADVELDLAPNALESFDADRCARLRDACAEHGVALGLHTLSAVNVAEVSPFLRDAADAYLKAYIDVAAATGAGWVVVHAGYHFTADRYARMAAALDRLNRAVDHAEARGVRLLLENTNREPDRAEVHYLAHSIEECRFFFDRIRSPRLGWSFTVNHATLEPEGIAGFLAALPFDRCGEVRLADSNGEYEEHLPPGEGMIDWPDLFRRTEGAGFAGHYMCAWGTLDDMVRGRAWMSRSA